VEEGELVGHGFLERVGGLGIFSSKHTHIVLNSSYTNYITIIYTHVG
jgi:hypothetical protein